MSRYEGILFDLDGTLCRQTGDVTAAYEAAFESVGIDPFGEPGALWPLLDGPPDPDDHVGYLAAGFARLAAIHDRRVDPVALATAFVAAADHGAVEFTPGAEAALDRAAETARTGLVTNGPRSRQSPKVETLGLADRLETVVYAGDLPRRKPHAEPFDRTLAALDVAPADTVYVGNSLKYDIAGAFTAGLDSVWLRPDPDADDEGYRPTWTLDSLDALDTVLEGSDESGD
ncbi:HAD family hydrolase [Halobaculum gomorrense]|uniref:Putative hydrolase of the HAD superfamily n=1 Tax=Halobaculum gomorrense TaxID=43928 RepID=A0A1M5JJT7_9EURY|nr:HAD family hydrolase [Halobaculum gomorrense]SHG40832.1 putative hydrolase of the HAD superfamily [Halobaculum gomorrense]